MKILLTGLGGFGQNHLRAWAEMGAASDLYVCDLDAERLSATERFGVDANRRTTDFSEFLPNVDIVDIVTPSTSHFDLAKMAIEAGKDVFVEKPMTMTSREASELAALAEQKSRIIQVGYYYRFHPTAIELSARIDAGDLGDIRYLAGSFYGFKRARTDVGVTHTDGIHFIDLFNWLVGENPINVYALIRDHFGRGMEDCSVVLIEYANGAFAKVESGYIQPGLHRDKVVPGAFTTKQVSVSGSRATAEIDFETEQMAFHDVHQEFLNGTWTPVLKSSEVPNTATRSPLQMVQAELTSFLGAVGDRVDAGVGPVGSGVVLAKVMEAIYESARTAKRVTVDY